MPLGGVGGPADNAITMSAPYSFRNEANIMAAEAEQSVVKQNQQ